MWYALSEKRKVHERTTYSLLDWLGDVGGLFDGLFLIVHWLIQPSVAYAAKNMIVAKVFPSFREGSPISSITKSKTCG